jgi:hypothetical protein
MRAGARVTPTRPFLVVVRILAAKAHDELAVVVRVHSVGLVGSGTLPAPLRVLGRWLLCQAPRLGERELLSVLAQLPFSAQSALPERGRN